jgi:hypothetical protein
VALLAGSLESCGGKATGLGADGSLLVVFMGLKTELPGSVGCFDMELG